MKTFHISGRMSASACILLVSYPLYSRTISENEVIPDSTQKVKDLKEVVVEGFGGKGRDKIGHISISGAEINKRPALFGEHDVIKALQTTSGVVSGTEGFAGLYVRGGETDQNLYLIDGLPLLNVYHFGGLFSTFSTNAIDRVNFYKGDFPSSFGERASSIVDIALRRPDLYNTTGSATIGLISGQVYFSTPIRKGNSAISLALRRTWFDVFSAPALAIVNATKKKDGQKTIFHYNFTDLLLKFNVTDRGRNDLSLLFFYGKDNFKLGEKNFDPDEPDLITKSDINRMSWGNWGFSADYRLSTSLGNLRIQPYISRAFASDTQENMTDRGNSGPLTSVTEVKPSVLQIGMKEYFSFPITRWLNGEAGLQQTWYDYNVGNPWAEYTGTTSAVNTDRFSPHSKNGLLSAFGELQYDIAGRMEGSLGLRVNRYLSNERKHWNLEPRFSLKLNLPHESSVSLSYSHVAQYAQQVSSNYMYLPSDAWQPTASHWKPLTCDIYSIGYFNNLQNGFNIKAEVWWKNMYNLADYKTNTSVTTTTLPWYEKMTFGKGWAYGIDLESDGRYKSLNWTIAYGLMWNWRKYPDLNSGLKFPAKFDNRHKIDITLGWKINDSLELSGQWEYMTGNRTTLSLYNISTPDNAFPDAPSRNPLEPGGNKVQEGIDYLDGRNNVRMPDFHRLNLNLSKKGRLSNRVTYQWDFGLYNAYCRMNPFSLVKRYINDSGNKTGDYRRFKTLSLLPILPSVSYTINF